MAELADAAGLGPAGRKPLGVQIPLPAPSTTPIVRRGLSIKSERVLKFQEEAMPEARR